MFRRQDYWPFAIGVFVFAGLIALPLIYGAMLEMKYETVLPGCLVACGIFVFSHTRDGKFSLARFIGAMAFLVMAVMKSAAHGGGSLPAVPGGILGFLVMSVCGWAGIGLGRLMNPGATEPAGTPEKVQPAAAKAPETAKASVAVAKLPRPSKCTWTCRCGELNIRVAGKCRVCGRDRSVGEIMVPGATDNLLTGTSAPA